MKKIISLLFVFIFMLFLNGCNATYVSGTYLYFDTVVKISAKCERDVLNGAFTLCEYYESVLSRTKQGSEVDTINSHDCPVTVSTDTAELIEKALYYSELSGGKYDITITPVYKLYDFENNIMPEEKELKAALSNVDYTKVQVSGNTVFADGVEIDLGSIAKGYIADKLCEYFKANGVKNAVINLGGNVYTLGEENKVVGIKKPFSDEIALYVSAVDSTFVTSGIDQRYIEKNGVYYHHIIDKSTGYGVQNSLASVTVVGKSSTDADALSTLLLLLGTNEGKELINSTDGFEAVFIEKDGNIILSDGLVQKGNTVFLR